MDYDEDRYEWNADTDDWGGEKYDRDPERVGVVHLGRIDDLFVAEDDETGISSQGPTKAAALANLAANLDVYEEGESGANDDWL